MHKRGCKLAGFGAQRQLAALTKADGRETYNCIECWQDVSVLEPNREETKQEEIARLRRETHGE